MPVRETQSRATLYDQADTPLIAGGCRPDLRGPGTGYCQPVTARRTRLGQRLGYWLLLAAVAVVLAACLLIMGG